jgi:hypothetical protein
VPADRAVSIAFAFKREQPPSGGPCASHEV